MYLLFVNAPACQEMVELVHQLIFLSLTKENMLQLLCVLLNEGGKLVGLLKGGGQCRWEDEGGGRTMWENEGGDGEEEEGDLIWRQGKGGHCILFVTKFDLFSTLNRKLPSEWD